MQPQGAVPSPEQQRLLTEIRVAEHEKQAAFDRQEFAALPTMQALIDRLQADLAALRQIDQMEPAEAKTLAIQQLDLTRQLDNLHPFASAHAAALKPSHVLGRGLASLSMAQLDVLEEIFLRLTLGVQEARTAKKLELQRLQAEVDRARDAKLDEIRSKIAAIQFAPSGSGGGDWRTLRHDGRGPDTLGFAADEGSPRQEVGVVQTSPREVMERFLAQTSGVCGDVEVFPGVRTCNVPMYAMCISMKMSKQRLPACR
jgi:hypothetical protein